MLDTNANVRLSEPPSRGAAQLTGELSTCCAEPIIPNPHHVLTYDPVTAEAVITRVDRRKCGRCKRVIID
jgi:hypothetical protein